MGNQLTVQNLLSNLQSYSLDLSTYQFASQNNHNQNSQLSIWKHKNNNSRLVEKKYYVRTWIHFYQLLQMFAFRYNSSYILATKYINISNPQIYQIDTQRAFSQTWISIFYQESITNLSYFQQIPEEDGGYFMLQSLKGFEKIVQKLRMVFKVRQQMFHITQKREVKIWISQEYYQDKNVNKVMALSSQSQMINEILSIIKKNIYFSTQSQKNINARRENIIQAMIIDEMIRMGLNSFKQVIKFMQDYLQRERISIGREMSCLSNLNQQELINIMNMTRLRTSKYNQNNQMVHINQEFIKKPIYQSNVFIIPTTQINYQNNNQIIYQQNNPQNQIINQNIQNNHNVVSHITIVRQQQKIQKQRNKVSRSKSNKKTGISLVKNNSLNQNHQSNTINQNHQSNTINQNHQSNSINQNFKYNPINKNHQSLIIIKPKTNTNSQIHINCNPSSNNKRNLSYQKRHDKQNNNSFILNNQNQYVSNNLNKRSSFIKKSNSVSNIHSRGITITNRQPFVNRNNQIVINNNSFNKHNKIPVNITLNNKNPQLRLNTQNTRINNVSYNNNSMINNNSSVGNFPAPLYSTNSIIIGTNNSFHKINNQNISLTNMSFDPLLPNQSLTKFHKQFINSSLNYSHSSFNSIPNTSLNANSTGMRSGNSSGQQFYDIPKIYVHSPKGKNKIFRTDSIKQQSIFNKEQFNDFKNQEKINKIKYKINDKNSEINNHKQQDKSEKTIMDGINDYKEGRKSGIQRIQRRQQYRQDFIEQNQNQIIKRQQRTSKLVQIQNYIKQNDSLFTHPLLYDYITNNTTDYITNNTSDHFYSKPLQIYSNSTTQKQIKNQSIKKLPYIDYLSNVQISESLDYHTALNIFQDQSLNYQQPNSTNQYKNNKPNSPNHYTLNDFPTIQEIQQNPLDQFYDKENGSFIPIPLNLIPQSQTNQKLNQLPPSSVRRGYQESVVVQYKKFHDDTNRSNNSPNKHYFSPLKKNNIITNQTNQVDQKSNKFKYATASNWKTSPSQPIAQRPHSYNNMINQQNIINNVHGNQRNNELSPVSKIIYRGQKPAINPLLLQDLQKMRQNRVF